MSMQWLRRLEYSTLSSYSLRVVDLAIFRILFSIFILLRVVPRAAWVHLAPHAFFNPPMGFAAMFSGPLPGSIILGLNLLLSVFAAMLLAGWKSKLASIGTGTSFLLLNSWEYAFGKINHDILLVVTPLVLAFSGWGRAVSLDAGRETFDPDEKATEWPVSLLAILIGFAMFTAGWAKLRTGWLDPKLLCTYGHLTQNYWVTGRETLTAHLALSVHSALLWKLADWSTLLFELGFLPAVLHRRSFSIFMAFATLFHLGVLISFDIAFSPNVLVYGAFLHFTRVFAAPHPSYLALRNLAIGGCLAAGTATVLGKSLCIMLHLPVDWIIISVGAVIGAGYLINESQSLLQWIIQSVSPIWIHSSNKMTS